MEGWQQLLATYPVLNSLFDALCVCIPLSCLLAYAGIFFISATAKILAIVRRRSAYDKCSKQIAMLGLILGWLLVVGLRVWLYATKAAREAGGSLDFLYEMSWMLLSMGILLSSIYYMLWRILKNMPVLHVTVGILGAAQNCIALVAILFSLRLSATVAQHDTMMLRLPDIFPTAWNSPIWSACCYTVPLLFAMPGAFCAFWLVLRRKSDDFGRDYYNAMIPWCAGWALYAWTILWITLVASTSMQVWLGINDAGFNMEDTIWDCARLLLWLLPIPIWITLRRCSIPMRFKFINFLAVLLVISFMIPYFLQITEI